MKHVLSWEKIAKKEGKIEALRDVARKLLRNGINIDIIATSTDLSKKEIEELAAAVK